jgi:hypothetical protein
MSGWNNGRWWVLAQDRSPLNGPMRSMGECEAWLRKRLGSAPKMIRNEMGFHEYATGHFVIEENGYGSEGLARRSACTDCYLVHAGECP